ncbi:MAG: EAL domain-containing protein [Rhizobiaceae bacterium]
MSLLQNMPLNASLMAAISMAVLILVIIRILAKNSPSAKIPHRDLSPQSPDRTFQTIENLCEGFYRANLDGKLFYSNSAFARMNGFQSGKHFVTELGSDKRGSYVNPERRQEFWQLLNANGRVTEFVSQIYRQNSEEKIWVSENAWIVRDSCGKPIHYEGSVREITEQMEREAFEKRLEKLANNLPGGLFQLLRYEDGSFSVPYASAGFCSLLGFDSINGLGDPSAYLDRIHKEDLIGYLQGMRQSGVTLEQWSSEFRFHHENGDTRWLMVTATPEKTDDGKIIWHGHMSDISGRKLAEEKVTQLAYFDGLTGLPNRGAIIERLEQEILANSRKHQHAALLFVDLDNFKTLNDTHGHEMGDLLLQQVAERLQNCCRSTDAVGRFGGDEFVILVSDLDGDHDKALSSTKAAAQKILLEFAKGFDLEKLHHITSPSIGAVLFGSDRPQASEIIKSADIAMYEAKKNGRNCYVLFDPANLKNVSRQYAMQEQLRSAIENEELFFEFQPQVDENENICGCEALVRWNHPEKGRLLPDEFVPMAENSGQIGAINKWAISTAITTLQRWSANEFTRNLTLSANIPGHEMCSTEFVSSVIHQLKSGDVDGSHLTLELTEQGMSRNTDEITRHMNELKKIGIRFSLDDFGTGNSSLSQLNNFPFDEVKIDGLFVSDLENRDASRSLIEAILGMAQALNLDTVAEHVGNHSQATFLKTRGCQKFQGYHYYAPMGELALLDVITKQNSQRHLAAAVGE